MPFKGCCLTPLAVLLPTIVNACGSLGSLTFLLGLNDIFPSIEAVNPAYLAFFLSVKTGFV
jgi:hypothetical protein